MKRIFNFMLLSILVATAAIMSSCSGSDDKIMALIPADKAVVANINMEKVLDAFDCSIKDGHLVLGPSMSALSRDVESNKEEIDKAIAIAKCLNYKSLFIVTDEDSKNPYIVVEITDHSGLAKAMEETEAEKLSAPSGYDAAYNVDHSTLLIRGDIAWLVAENNLDKATDLIDAEIKSAEKANLTGMGDISDLMAKDSEAVKMVINTTSLSKTAGAASYVFVNINEKDNALIATGLSFNDKYEAMSSVGTIDIDPAALAFIPNDFNVFYAGGIGKDYPWDSMFSSLAAAGGYEAAGVIEVVKPYLKAIDGTVMVGCCINQNSINAIQSENYGSFPFLFMVKMDGVKAAEATGMMTDFLKQNMVPYTTAPNGLNNVNLGPGNAFTFGVAEGYLTVADVNISSSNSNSLAAEAKGHKLYGIARINSLQEVGAPIPWGIDLTIADDNDGTVVITLKLIGADGKIIPTLLNTFGGL